MSIAARHGGARTKDIVSFDGAVRVRTAFHQPSSAEAVPKCGVRKASIPRGGGYSYSAASFGEAVAVYDMTGVDRILSFDRTSGLVKAQAGVTIGALSLACAAEGRWLPTVPGYPAITMGGSVATNVHGKNPQRWGTIRQYLHALTLFHPSHGVMELRAGRDDALLDLTCGGMGLTGIILDVTVATVPLPGAILRCERMPVGSLEETSAWLQDYAGQYDFAYTWHDGFASSHRFGRGFIFCGVFVDGQVRPEPRHRDWRTTLSATNRHSWRISLWSPPMAWVANGAYYAVNRLRSASFDLPFFESLFPFARAATYFKLYGRAGMMEYQVIVPTDSCEAFLRALQHEMLRRRAPTVLISMKMFSGVPGLLRYEARGVSVTINWPRCRAAETMAEYVDELVIAVGGIPNLIKDSRIARRTVERCYPGYEEFRSRLHQYDSERIFSSELAQRLGL